MQELATASLSGVGHRRLLCSADRTELIVEGMLVDLVAEKEHERAQNRMDYLANQIAAKLSGG